jgi:hypothetical protein
VSDPTNPSYYKKGDIETYDFIRAKGLGFEAGNIVKYLVRYREKGGVQDLQKALWYLGKLIDRTKKVEAAKQQAKRELLDSLASFHAGDTFPTADKMMEAKEILDDLARHNAGGHCNCTGRTQRFACPVHHLGRTPGDRRYDNLAGGINQTGTHEELEN